MPQPAVSNSIMALGDEIGCRLLNRVSEKALMPQAREHLQIHAEKVLWEMNTALAALRQLGKWGNSRLRVGVSTTTCKHVTPAVLVPFKRHCSNRKLSIEPRDGHWNIDGVMENRSARAVVLELRTAQPLEFHPIFEEKLFFIVSPQHPVRKIRRSTLVARMPPANAPTAK